MFPYTEDCNCILVRRAKACQFQTVILCYVQIPSQLFDLRAVCRGNNELFLVPWNKYIRLNITTILRHTTVCYWSSTL